MNHSTTHRLVRGTASALASTLLCLAAHAQTAGFQRGPDPSTAALESSAGPYAVMTIKVASQSDFGGGVVYYPRSTAEGTFGAIALVPGFLGTQADNQWWAQLLASHGFVVINVSTKSVFEWPAARARELAAALKKVVSMSQTPGSPLVGKVDPQRQGVMGHSMGGGGTMEAARDNPALKAAIPMAPWSPIKDFTKVTVPTMVIACQNDPIATSSPDKIYDGLSPLLNKAYLQIADNTHTCTTSSTSAVNKTMLGKYGVSWMKRFIDEDTRYSAFLCGAPHQADLVATGTVVSGYKDTCPY